MDIIYFSKNIGVFVNAGILLIITFVGVIIWLKHSLRKLK